MPEDIINYQWKRFHKSTLVILLGISLLISAMNPAAAQNRPQQTNNAFIVQLASAQDKSDDSLLSIQFANVTLQKALELLAEEINVGFSYNPDIMPDKRVSFSMSNVPPHEVIYKLLEGTNLEPVLPPSKDVIVIRERETTEEQEQLQETVRGTVVDTQTGEALPGVNILVQGTTDMGTTTNIDGEFELRVPSLEATLVFSYIGYQRLELPIDNRIEINVELSSDVQLMDDIVVIGYGSVRKSDLTGSVSSISERDINLTSISSLDQSLQGRAAGVQVTQSSAQPGGATSIRIRGGNSINAGNEPLYVIDGIPLYNDNIGSQAGVIVAPSQNALATLNPNDIVSIEILKDASATAIYGSRGSNGVVMVTTKRGQEGAHQVDISSYYGVQKARRIIPMLNAREYAEFRNEAFVNGGGLPTYSEEEVATMGEGTNWQEALFRTAPTQNHQLSFSGGSEDYQYAISTNLYERQGIVLNTGFERQSIRMNLDANIDRKLKIGSSLSVSRTHSDVARTGGGARGTSAIQSSSGSIVASAIFYNPIIPVYDTNGDYTYDNDSDTQGSGGGNQRNVPFGNPVAYAELSTNENINARVFGNLYGEYSFLENLQLRVNFGGDLLYNKQNKYEPSTIRMGRSQNGNAVIGTLNSYSWTNENTLTYTNEFNNTHSINALVGFTAKKFNSESTYSRATGFTNDVLRFHNLSAGEVERTPRSDFRDWSLLSYLARLNYTYDNKYLLTLTSRIDGSSRFGDANKYGFFPSGALAWRISEEEFLKSKNVIDDLKLRFSAGMTGNQEIPLYQSLPVLSETSYSFGANERIGFSPVRIANPDLKWETTTQYDIGLDIGLFDNRLAITTDLYYKKTKDLLLERLLPRSSGFFSAMQNIGSVVNKGLEFGLSFNNTYGNFFWTSNFNISFNKNKVLDLGEESGRFIDPGFNLFKGQAVSKLAVGQPIGNFVGYESDGIFNNQEEIENSAQPEAKIGSRRYVDHNQDGRIDDNDRVIIGNALPDFTGGFNNTFGYKNFELDVLFTYSAGNDIYNLVQLEAEFLNGRQNNSRSVLDRWTPTNTDTDVQKASNPLISNTRQSNSRYIEDGSYLRMKNIRFTYNIPINSINMSYLRYAQVYVNGQNLVTFTKYSGYDPEVNLAQESNILKGFDYGVYPSAKAYMIGIRIGL